MPRPASTAAQQTTYSGPDDPSDCTRRDVHRQGGEHSGSSVFTLKYDETAPQASATASRAPDVNSWYNHDLTVSFNGSDATSGLDVCDAPKGVLGPRLRQRDRLGNCRDIAGNTVHSIARNQVRRDCPSGDGHAYRQPNAKGWYKALVTVAFAGTDAISGLDSCVAPKRLLRARQRKRLGERHLRGQRGERGQHVVLAQVRRDSATDDRDPQRQPNVNGWYKAAISVSFSGTDATAGIDSCDAPKSYSGPGQRATPRERGLPRQRREQRRGLVRAQVRRDQPDSHAAAAGRQPNANGWYRTSRSTVDFTGGDATSGVDSCDAPKTYAGPDSADSLCGR